MTAPSAAPPVRFDTLVALGQLAAVSTTVAQAVDMLASHVAANERAIANLAAALAVVNSRLMKLEGVVPAGRKEVQ